MMNLFKITQKEYEEFMRRLHLSRINGVVFITGDQINRTKKKIRKHAYPLYELNSLV